ncbi:hypothetical protein ACVIIW_003661 [Bradyrhizobium sp. USDA 4449]
MSDGAADFAADTPEPKSVFDIAFPIAFGVAALLTTAVWFAAIAWVAWQPIRVLLGWILA